MTELSGAMKDFVEKCGDRYGYGGRIETIRAMEFGRLKGLTYLDHTGAALYPQSLLKRVYEDFSNNVYGNPHSRNSSSQAVADIIEQVRSRILQLFNTTPENHSVIFTAGATAALKLLADCFDWKVMDRKDSPSRSCFCYLHENHTSVIGMREKAALNGAQVVCVTEEDMHVIKKKLNSSLKSTETEPLLAMDSPSVAVNNSVRESSSYCHSLFAFPAMCNFSGRKYPLEWVSQAQTGCLAAEGDLSHWFVLLDAASFVSTSSLDLSSCMADFVPVSFYKIFGLPTGVGALIVRNCSSYVLKKSYYGGGTVQSSISSETFHILKTNLAERFEDGTVSFLDIVVLHHAFDTFEELTGSMTAVANHTYSITSFVYKEMLTLYHSNGKPLCEIYCDTGFMDETVQGPVLNFNLLRESGDYVGFSEVEKMASLYNIHLRTGCFCNTGACQRYLDISNERVKENLSAGHVCGDDVDLINGKPTGSVRISFGYISSFHDAQVFLNFLKECFLQTGECGIQKTMLAVCKRSVSETSDRTDTKHPESCGRSVSSEPLKGVLYNINKITGLESDLSDAAKSSEPVFSSVQNGNWNSLSGLKRNKFQEKPTTNHCEHYSRPTVSSSGLSCLSSVSLDKIFIYPIKSCAAFEVQEWQVGPRGFLYDRQWMIVSEAGVCLNQKREPRLCLIKPVIDLASKLLFICAPGMSTLVLPLQSNKGSHVLNCKAKLCQTKVCGDRVSALDSGEEAAKWITCFMRKKCRLIEHQKEDRRTCKLAGNHEGHENPLSLANESQFLLVSRESTEQLLSCIGDTSEERAASSTASENQLVLIQAPLETDKLIDRFRANLVISGGGLPFIEDSWRTVKIGNLTFECQGKCNRCQMVCVDQDTGTKTAEPLKTLGKLRGSRMPFGIHLAHVPTNKESFILHSGDIVTVTT